MKIISGIQLQSIHCLLITLLIPPPEISSSACVVMQVAVWRSGIALVSINEINIRRVRLLIVLRWVRMTVSGFNSRCRTFRYVTNQPPKANSAFHPSGVGK